MKRDQDRTLWELTRGQRFRYSAAMVAMAVGFALAFGVPQVCRIAIDDVVAGTGDAAPA